MKKLLFFVFLLVSGFCCASAPLAKSYTDEFVPKESKFMEAEQLIGVVPLGSTEEQQLRIMRPYPYPASYDSSDPLNPYGETARDIADRMKRSQSDLLP